MSSGRSPEGGEGKPRQGLVCGVPTGPRGLSAQLGLTHSSLRLGQQGRCLGAWAHNPGTERPVSGNRGPRTSAQRGGGREVAGGGARGPGRPTCPAQSSRGAGGGQRDPFSLLLPLGRALPGWRGRPTRARPVTGGRSLPPVDEGTRGRGDEGRVTDGGGTDPECAHRARGRGADASPLHTPSCARPAHARAATLGPQGRADAEPGARWAWRSRARRGPRTRLLPR